MARGRLGFLQWLAVAVIVPVMSIWTRPTWRGGEHLIKNQGFIVVSNHHSHFDPLPLAHFIYRNGVWPRFLGKASVFRVPLIGSWLRRIKQVPVERGTADAARSVEVLTAAVQEGGAVVIYPEGTTTREPGLWPMRGKTGAARIALATGAPVVPIVTWGAHRVFDPRSGRFHPGVRIPVTVMAAAPIDLSRWAGAEPTKAVLEEMTDAIMLHLRDMLAEVRGETPPPLWPAATGPRERTPVEGPAAGQPEAARAEETQRDRKGRA